VSRGIGVTVARFQVPNLTPGHMDLLDLIREHHDQVVVFLGCSPASFTKNNPLPYWMREQMVRDRYRNALIYPLVDQPTDELWTKQLDGILNSAFPGQDCTLYAGRDGFLKHYLGNRKKLEVARIEGPTGSEIRDKTATSLTSNADMRAGAIFSIQNAFTRVNQTVDVAIVRSFDGFDMPEVLMARKAVEERPIGWRFIGGFVDPSDLSLEMAAAREAKEETGLNLRRPQYIGSFRIDDWRYRNSPESIMTSFFLADCVPGESLLAKPADDIAAVAWIRLDEVEQHVLPLHRPLATALSLFLIQGKAV
jgi:bifunctional NMN adenylyltransferase/nudix hydrolase